MKIAIKGMVCQHCVQAVKETIEELHLTPEEVSLGQAIVKEELPPMMLKQLSKALEEKGFSLIDSPEARLVEKVKLMIIDHIRNPHECRLNLSACLEDKLNMSYDTMSRVFSAQEGRTIEKYQMAQRVEWVKELLGYGELSVSEIAHITGYSSVAHLSRQFKSVTGLTPTEYLKGAMNRKGLNEV